MSAELLGSVPNTPEAPPPAPPAAVDVTAPDAPRRSRAERLAAAAARMAGREPVAAAPVALSGVEPPAASPDVKPAPDTAVEPVQKPGESDAKFEARLAKSMADLTKANNAIRERDDKIKASTSATEQLKADMAKLQAQIEALKDPTLALKHAGTTFDDYAAKVLKGEVKALTPEDLAREQADEGTKALRAKVEALEAKAQADADTLAQSQAEAKAQEARTKDLATVKGMVEASKSTSPLVASLPWAPERILDLCYARRTNDVAAVTAEFEQALLNDAEALLTPTTLAALLKRQPKLRETLRPVFGTEPSRKTPDSSGSPRVLASDMLSAATDPKDRPLTPAEKRKRALAMLNGG